MKRRLSSTPEAAARLSVSPRALNRWAQEGLVTPAFRSPGGRDYWDVDDLRTQVAALPARFSGAAGVHDGGSDRRRADRRRVR
ncbi:MerR family transcriptional regulator [Pseudonocardia endophytica]|uniref:HTH merR-type domain-containing protein n=1 Tax=Pseudonocardia endophytica TaxID=401976 RepID=A0A4R1HI53_PSEEN|nr:MerR family transcriptional regulator [Pseudonocardia endophytica]TCK20523.1 hypothetical protein EV378_4482 [Pseudonocardia endophytica]